MCESTNGKISAAELAKQHMTEVHEVWDDPERGAPSEHVDLMCGCTMVYRPIWSGDHRKYIKTNFGHIERFAPGVCEGKHV